MAEATFVQEGNSIDHTPGSALAAGQVVPLGGFVGIPMRPIESGELSALRVRGLFKVTKQTGVTWSAGDPIYWDDAANHANKTAGGNTLMGLAERDAASGDTVGYVLVAPMTAV